MAAFGCICAAPIRKPAEFELGGGDFPSRPEEAEIKETYVEAQWGRGFLARLAALLLKATLSAVNCFWSLLGHVYYLINRLVIMH